jgi:hypothetical protein
MLKPVPTIIAPFVEVVAAGKSAAVIAAKAPVSFKNLLAVVLTKVGPLPNFPLALLSPIIK